MSDRMSVHARTRCHGAMVPAPVPRHPPPGSVQTPQDPFGGQKCNFGIEISGLGMPRADPLNNTVNAMVQETPSRNQAPNKKI